MYSKMAEIPERPFDVRCHGEVKFMWLRRNFHSVESTICQRFNISKTSEDMTLTMTLKRSGTKCPVNEQSLWEHWNQIRELEITLPIVARREMANADLLKVTIEGIVCQINDLPSKSSTLVQRHRKELGLMSNIDESKDMFRKSFGFVKDLNVLVNDWKICTRRGTSSRIVGSKTEEVTKIDFVVTSLGDIGEKSAKTFEEMINFCSSITLAIQRLSYDLVNNDYKAVAEELNLLLIKAERLLADKGKEMNSVTGQLDKKLQDSMGNIDAASDVIASQRKKMEGELGEKEDKKRQIEDYVQKQMVEIEHCKREIARSREEVAKLEKKQKDATIGTGVAIGACVVVSGIIPPAAPVLLPAAVATGVGVGTFISDLNDKISGLNDRKDSAISTKQSEERRKKLLEDELVKIKRDMNELMPVVDCLHKIWGRIGTVKSTVSKMNSFWPDLLVFYTSMNKFEQQLVSMLEVETSKNPIIHFTGFKSQILNLQARLVCLLEVCESCHEDVKTTLEDLRVYRFGLFEGPGWPIENIHRD